MAIEDLVTGALAGDIHEEESLESSVDALHGPITAGSLLHTGRKIENDLQSAEGMEFHRLASILGNAFISLGRMKDDRYLWQIEGYCTSLSMLGSEIVARSNDYLHSGEGRGSTLTFIHQALDIHYLTHLGSSLDERMQIMEEVWQDDTTARLARLGSVKPPTAKRWMQGSYPSSAAWEIQKASAIIYHLRSSLNMSDEAIREWFDLPLSDGTSPFAHVCSRACTTLRGGEVRKDELTRALERMGIEAFSWAAEMTFPH